MLSVRPSGRHLIHSQVPSCLASPQSVPPDSLEQLLFVLVRDAQGPTRTMENLLRSSQKYWENQPCHYHLFIRLIWIPTPVCCLGALPVLTKLYWTMTLEDARTPTTMIHLR
jgi:hypothetical protein